MSGPRQRPLRCRCSIPDTGCTEDATAEDMLCDICRDRFGHAHVASTNRPSDAPMIPLSGRIELRYADEPDVD